MLKTAHFSVFILQTNKKSINMFRNTFVSVSVPLKTRKKCLCYSYAICYVKVVFSPQGAFLFVCLVNRNFNFNYYTLSNIFVCDCFIFKMLLKCCLSVFKIIMLVNTNVDFLVISKTVQSFKKIRVSSGDTNSVFKDHTDFHKPLFYITLQKLTKLEKL